MQRRHILIATCITLVSVSILIMAFRLSFDHSPIIHEHHPFPLSIDQMAFSLTDQDDNPVGPDRLLGHPSMVFFGFTTCPDICPTTLADISDWLDGLGDDSQQLNTIFITVDPDRDTVAVLADYLHYFHPMIQGWTGSKTQIAKAAREFGVVYKAVKIDEGGYIMDHMASIFLFDATGRFVSTIDQHESHEFALLKIRRVLSKNKSSLCLKKVNCLVNKSRDLN